MAVIDAIEIGSLVTRTPGVYGGRACLAGTRFPILQVAVLHNAGESPEQIAGDYSLPLAHVYAGIAYYLVNKSEIDAELYEEHEEYEIARNADLADPERASA